MPENSTMTHLDLFSGIGGFALAARWSGIETVAFCEKEPFCQEVLKKNFPGVPIYGDIKTMSGEPFRGIDIITGGYPCQPFSLAGKRAGKNDDRHLWPEMRRIIAEALPAWVVAENVAGHITMGLDEVLSDLEGLNYFAFAVVIPACAVDAPHRRDRVWVVANSKDGGLRRRGASGETGQPSCCGETMADSNSDRESQSTGGLKKFWNGVEFGCETLAHAEILGRDEPSIEKPGKHPGKWPWAARGCCSPVSNSDNAGREEQRVAISEKPKLKTPECGCRWSPEPGVGRVAHGIPRRVDRLKSLGNAIVPQVAYEILKNILEGGA